MESLPGEAGEVREPASTALPSRAKFKDFAEVAARNPFGAAATVAGVLAGELASAVLLGIASALSGRGHTLSTLVRDVVGLLGLWIGFVGTAIWVSLAHGAHKSLGTRLREDYGLSIRWSDLPIGIVAGLFGQYVLVLVLELPLYPFVPHLFQRLGAPARSLTAGESGLELALIGVLVCVGSPIVEELFFRGLLLRGLLGISRDRLGWRALPAVFASAALSGVIFGLVHFEALQLLALSGFGFVLALLAVRTGRLGAGIVAHLTFNAMTFISLALAR